MGTTIQVLVHGLIYLATFAIVAWMAGALYYDVGRGSKLAWILVVLWITAVLVALVVWQPVSKPFLVISAVFGLFLTWWFSQKPSNERAWEPTSAVLASVDIRGDQATIKNVRNTEYRAFEDCTPRYETRSYHLSRLRGMDVLITYWGSRWMCHPILTFDFGIDGRVCFSIEVRYRVKQKYDLMRSLYRQQELICIVCDERDAILRRTRYSENHDAYLYRIYAKEREVRQFFLESAEQSNALIETPQWYHGLTANCTTSIYSARRDRLAWDWRLLFNGKLDQLLYDRQRLDQRLPFEYLKRQSWINEIANRAPLEGFGEFIRQELVAYEPVVGEKTT